jgi:hypothetical protein
MFLKELMKSLRTKGEGMNTDNFTERLPMLRCTPEMKNALQKIAQRSVARNIADHMRYALERYIEDNAELVESEEKEKVGV